VPELLKPIVSTPAVEALAHALAERKRCVATGVAGSSVALTAASIHLITKHPVIVVCAHIDEADDALDEILGLGVQGLRLPALEVLPGETNVSLDQLAERLAMTREIIAGSNLGVIIAPVQALMQHVPAPKRLDSLAVTVRKGETVSQSGLVNWLAGAGYSRVETIEEPGDFAIRGGILDVFPPGGSTGSDPRAAAPGVPVRIEFFGDEVERLAEVDIETMGSDRAADSVELYSPDVKQVMAGETINVLELMPRDAVVILHETMEVVEQARGYFERASDGDVISGPPAVLKLLETRFHALTELNQFSAGAAATDARIELPVAALPAFPRDLNEAVEELIQLAAPPESLRVVVWCRNEGELSRLNELLGQVDSEWKSRITATEGTLSRGFVWDGGGRSSVAYVPYHELLNKFTVRRRGGRLRGARAMDTFLDFQAGDYVVHTDHGIAKFVGLVMLEPRRVPGRAPAGIKRESAEPEEFLTLEFAGGAKLHVPCAQIDLVQKYVGGFGGKPPLSTLGGQRWKSQKDRTAESVRDLAAEMLRVRAAREHMPGIAFPADTPWQKEFEAEFPYTETEDQLAALSEIKKDMTRARPMDRLICGDVGFGKTEVAIRAAFKAVEHGRQVAVLVPTTVLCEQHERTFRSRFAGYPFRIESLSRFKTGRESTEILKAAREGKVDILIGTHRLLSKDVNLPNLGLVIVDEEQRFGVEHKESLLRFRLTVDVLTLSATPIPRTLHMSMLGIRDISSLTTAPVDRRAIVTEVIPYNERRIQQAIARELSRDGQVFFLHNRVHDILSVADDVRRMAPDARVLVGHGQMDPDELEDVILKFVRREADILVSTTIIESGIDIASANTMIIKDADRFGLAELHQLRGRVGRSKHRAYCYFLLPNDRTVKEIAQKRLKAIEQYSMLGAGFKIAMRDLEIRGAGNILGPEQSGHIAAVGYEMYCRLLDDAVHELKNEPRAQNSSSVAIEIGLSASIPRAYIPSEQRRLEAYRRLAFASTMEQLQAVRTDLAAAYGDPPRASYRLFDLCELRVRALELKVRNITVREKDVIFFTNEPAPLAAMLARVPEGSSVAKEATIRVLDPKEPGMPFEVYFRPPEKYLDPDTLLRVLRKRMSP